MKCSLLNKIKQVFFYLWFIATVSGIMVCLLCAVYSIPIEKIRMNTVKSAEILNTTHKVLWYKDRIPGANVDKITDARMLSMASFLGKNGAFIDSLLNPETYYVWWAPTSLSQSLSQDTLEELRVDYYPRFWHGYLILLKPLSVFFDLWSIRIINLAVQLILLIAILYLMYKRLGFKHCVAFLIAMCFFNPYTSWMCLEYATDINIMLLATLWVLLVHHIDDKYMFFIIGSVTILFDFITFPLITLGIPLIVYLCLYERSFRGDIVCVIKNSLLWGIGYVLMWLSKWILATWITGENVFKEGIDNVLHRSYGYKVGDSVLASDINFFKALELNYAEIYGIYAGYYLGGFLVLILVYRLFVAFKIHYNRRVFCLFGVALMPFIWSAVLVNHSVIHAYMTHKIFIITIYAVLSAIACCLQSETMLKKRKLEWKLHF